MIREHRELLRTFLGNYEIKDIDACLDAFELIIDELTRWNRVINLTAIRDEHGIVVRHLIDSLTPLQFIGEGDFILDIGSGAGFPGIPIKLARPSVRLVMLDARSKKINFINSMINLLKLTDTTAIHQRAEAEDFRELMAGSFDVVISRAAFPLPELASLSLPYLKDDGRLIAMQSKRTEGVDDMEGLTRIDELITDLPDGSLRKIMVFGKG
ncbi:MAG: 16S rRNA (guanine(527)-N(7))-methyltransferase RsmG [Deltaproteobacteria bacterium]|nr:16S rRNA (guanine(527)-N(7))-methyltransferase RsmG [Deltaproteobacteria bacterium]MCL5276328.1 16S rRNA (guanine(527)-N(7))-methyltransferase RsmG [Deltaproteobacteria bacterium]